MMTAGLKWASLHHSRVSAAASSLLVQLMIIPIDYCPLICKKMISMQREDCGGGEKG